MRVDVFFGDDDTVCVSIVVIMRKIGIGVWTLDNARVFLVRMEK